MYTKVLNLRVFLTLMRFEFWAVARSENPGGHVVLGGEIYELYLYMLPTTYR